MEEQYNKTAAEIATKIKISEVGGMNVKKTKINMRQTTGICKPVNSSSFWTKKTVEELAKEQGVKPIKDYNELTGFWPEGADFDTFYEAAVNSRKHANVPDR